MSFDVKKRFDHQVLDLTPQAVNDVDLNYVDFLNMVGASRFPSLKTILICSWLGDTLLYHPTLSHSIMRGFQTTPTLLGLFVVILSLSLAQVSIADHCDPDTCPDSPVFVQFENTDCSGARQYYSLDDDWNVCKAGHGNSTIATYSSTYMEQARYRGETCGAGEEFPAVEAHRQIFGNCFDYGWLAKFASKFSIGRRLSKKFSNGGPRGLMYLRNAKQQTSPQVPIDKPGRPLAGVRAIPCQSYDDCSSKGFYFIGTFGEGCNFPANSYFTFNVSKNVCYVTSGSYVSFSCSNKHTLQALYSRNGDCSLPHTASLLGGECGSPDYKEVYCAAEPSFSKTLLTQKNRTITPPLRSSSNSEMPNVDICLASALV